MNNISGMLQVYSDFGQDWTRIQSLIKCRSISKAYKMHDITNAQL